MKSFVKTAVAAGIVMTLAGCSSLNSTTTIEKVDPNAAQVPEWYLVPGEDSESVVFASATSVSDDMEFAIAKASHQARVILAEKIASTATESMKQFKSDNAKGGTSLSTQTTEMVTKSEFNDVNVSGYRIIQKKVYREDDMYRVYVLVSLPRDNRFTVSRSGETQITPLESQRAAQIMSEL